MLEAHAIRISMDGKGRWVDNVFVERLWHCLQYEEVYLKAYESLSQAREGIARTWTFSTPRGDTTRWSAALPTPSIINPSARDAGPSNRNDTYRPVQMPGSTSLCRHP